ncbi:out at first [Carabus blaptoides fortunei]
MLKFDKIGFDRSDVQILKALVLGEEERGQSQYQVMCFVCHFQKGDFISSDAMAKLRQKNPGTVRTPEEDRGHDNFTMDYFVQLDRSSVISKHIAGTCSEAAEATYTRHVDIQQWAASPGASESSLLTAVRKFPASPDQSGSDNTVVQRASGTTDTLARCGETPSMWSPCRCHLELCVGWYPCGLKYCKGKGETKSSAMTYRCGIKTCKKYYLFSYFVPQKQMCLWDE